MTTVDPGGVKIFFLIHGQVKHLMSNFTPSPENGDVTKCTHNCTNALFPNATKSLPKIFQNDLQSYKAYEMPMEQAGLGKGHSARQQIDNVSESWTAKGSTTKCQSVLWITQRMLIVCSI
jgi:hypothetical protein